MLDHLPRPILDAVEWYGLDNLKVLAVVAAFWAIVFFGWPLTRGSARLGWRALSWPFRSTPPVPPSELVRGILNAINSPDAVWCDKTNELAAEEVELRLAGSWKGCEAMGGDLDLLHVGKVSAYSDLTCEERLAVVKAARGRVAELEAEALQARREQHLGRLNMAQAAKPAKPPLRGGLNSAPKKIG